MFIKKVTIKNHPFFEDTELELKETNFLIGDNGVGKSLFMSHFANQESYLNNDWNEITNTFLFDDKEIRHHELTSKKQSVVFIPADRNLSPEIGGQQNINSFDKDLNMGRLGWKILQKNCNNFQININDSKSKLPILTLGDKLDKFKSKDKVIINTFTLYSFSLANKIYQFQLSKKNLILLEDPEIYAHPNAQKEIVDKLFFEIKVQKIISTHSPFIVKNYLGDENSAIFVFRKNENGKVKIEDINKEKNKLFPFSPTLSEVMYKAFDMPTNDFHNELYGYIQSKYKNIFSEKINKHGTENEKGFLKYFNEESKKYEYITLHKYIRHQIHHPENEVNEKHTPEQLKESIQQMRDYLNKSTN